jgi:hypothetical protein
LEEREDIEKMGECYLEIDKMYDEIGEEFAEIWYYGTEPIYDVKLPSLSTTVAMDVRNWSNDIRYRMTILKQDITNVDILLTLSRNPMHRVLDKGVDLSMKTCEEVLVFMEDLLLPKTLLIPCDNEFGTNETMNQTTGANHNNVLPRENAGVVLQLLDRNTSVDTLVDRGASN